MLMSHRVRVAAVSAALLVLPMGAADADDQPGPLVCAATDVAGCKEDDHCLQGSAAAFNLPVLFKINTADKTVESARLGGERRVSAIERVEMREGVLILQGSDERAAWLATIRLASGRLTVTAAREGEAYVVFGACAPL